MRDPTAPAYYDRRAPEYHDWNLGRGGYAALERPRFDDELGAVVAALAELPPARTLAVACGTGSSLATCPKRSRRSTASVIAARVLLTELGSGEVLHDGTRSLVVRSRR